MGSMLAWGSKVIARKGPFLSGTAPFVQHSLAAISLHFGYLPVQLVLCLVQTTKRHSATSSSAWGRFSQMTKKDGLYILPSLPIKRTLKLHYYKLLLIMQQSLELQELSGEGARVRVRLWGGVGEGVIVERRVAWSHDWWQGKTQASSMNRVSPRCSGWALKVSNVAAEEGINRLQESAIRAVWKLSCPPSIQKATLEVSSVFI